MLSGDFERKLKKLNPRLKIFCGDDRYKPAGLYYVVGNEYVQICGVDKNYIPEYTIWDDKGHIIKAGWRRAISQLLQRHLVNREKVMKVFNTRLEGMNKQCPAIYDPLSVEIGRLQSKAMSKGHIDVDWMMDIANEIKKKPELQGVRTY